MRMCTQSRKPVTDTFIYASVKARGACVCTSACTAQCVRDHHNEHTRFLRHTDNFCEEVSEAESTQQQTCVSIQRRTHMNVCIRVNYMHKHSRCMRLFQASLVISTRLPVHPHTKLLSHSRARMHMSTHTRMHAHARARIHMRTRMRMRTRAYDHMSTHTRARAHTHTATFGWPRRLAAKRSLHLVVRPC